ncbi:MAG TPA: flagellar assembly protein FliX [Acetobacteraceae bacterium]|jgi:hypothetical protein
MSMIDGLGPTPPARSGMRSGVAGRAGFAVPPDAGRNAQMPAVGMPTPVALDAMLALQETEVEAEQDRVARRYGQAVLAALDTLQRVLLGGGDIARILDRLHTLADGAPKAADPALGAILDSIRLRAWVELARHGV